MNQDKATELARRAINILFVSNPKGTSIGVLVGVILHGIIGVLSPALKTIEWLNMGALQLWHLICLGVATMNIPPYLKRHEIDPSIQSAFEYIKLQQDNGNISEWQARQMYINLSHKVLENIVLEANAASKIENLASPTTPDENTNK